MQDSNHVSNVFTQKHRVLTNHGYEHTGSVSSNSSGSGSNGSDIGQRQQTIERSNKQLMGLDDENHWCDIEMSHQQSKNRNEVQNSKVKQG